MRNEVRNASGFFRVVQKSALVGRRYRLREWWIEGYSMMNPKPSLDVLSRRMASAMFAVLLLTACSKTVQWEEEVPLNTGDTIWVKRTVKYKIGGDAGNPFDMAYRPERNEQIEFTWSGNFYRYNGDARVLLLAISPTRQPTLVAPAEANAWYAVHSYKCTIPYYVQLIPDATGSAWTWPSKIETWLYNMTPNLLLPRYPLSRMQQRYTAADVQRENYPGTENNSSQQKINPAYTGDHCKREEK